MKNNVKSEWVWANAGSGKTTALTARVVRLLLLGVPPERIVCITYTKAAAAEMRARVLARLRDLLLMPEHEARDTIAALVEQDATDAMLTRARQLFGMVLDSPSGGVMLTTIHGFCQNILRRFPLEAGIAPQFAVLEDAAAEDILTRAKHALLTGLDAADTDLRDALALIGARGGEYGFDTLCDDILGHRRTWEALWRGQSTASLREAIYAQHAIETDATDEGFAEALCAMLAAQEAALAACLPTMATHSKKTEHKYATGLAQVLATTDRREAIPHLVALLLTGDDTIRADIAKLDAQAVITPLAQAALRYRQQGAALRCAEESMAVALLARALLDLYASGKAAQYALDYDDLIDRTRQLVSHPETLGWVMSKLDHRIDHLLIDEAQDNSTVQWQLAQVLVEELIASNAGMGSAGVPRSLLVVGDEKQSIYSFQGAAPEQFQHYRQVFGAMLDGSDSPLSQRALDASYRSAKPVLDLVDAVCALPEVAHALTQEGTFFPHVLTRHGAAGRVVLHPPVIAPEREKRPPLTLPLEYSISSNAAQVLAEEIAQQVRQQMAHGVRAGEVLILVHRRRPMVQPLIRALQREGIAVAGIDRLTLSEHLAVRDLLALMAWCLSETDDLALAQVLRSPLVGISDDTLRALAFGREGSLWQAVAAHYPWLAAARGRARDTPYAFLTWVLEGQGRRTAFARRFGEEVHEVLDELKAQAAAMPADRRQTLMQFHAWMSRNTRQIKREQENGARDEVRIMTVHGSKGLEAKHVILADTVRVPTTQQERSYFMPNARGQRLPLLALSPEGKKATRLQQAKERRKQELVSEYYRLLYVALTRARDTLQVFGHASKKGEVAQGSWYALVAEAMRRIGTEQADGGWLYAQGAPVATPAVPAHAAPPAPAWLFTPPAVRQQAAALAPSRVAEFVPSPYVVQAARGAKERGVRLHAILEFMRADTTPAQLTAMIAYLAPDWSAQEQQAAAAEVLALRAAEPWLWQGRRQAEVSITGTVAGQVAHGQIDLLVETVQGLVILDYKTGRAVPERAEDIPESYRAQLALYRQLVQGIYPQTPIRTAILWTAVPRLMWVAA